MKEYKRLTKKSWHDTKFCGLNEREVLNRLWEVENKIENGTLIELPCKVGDIVYELIQGMPIQEWEIESIDWGRTYGKNYVMWAERKKDLAHWKFWKEDFGERLFITKAEAEKKLEEELKNER